MRKTYLTVALAITLAGSMMLSSCIGSFSLTGKLLSWNRQVGTKFVNELVFFAFWILPVYEVSGLADVLVLNSIEFWSGNNPMAKSEKIIDGKDGRYLVKCDGKGYDVIGLNDGSKVRLDFNTERQEWSVNFGEESHVLFTFVDDTHVRVPAGSGNDYTTVEISEAGVYAYSQLVSNSGNLAIR